MKLFGLVFLSLWVSMSGAATLRFRVVEAGPAVTIGARFSLRVNGIDWFPEKIGAAGVRFISLHDSKQQLFVATYTTADGLVEVFLPAGVERVELRVARGFEYRPQRIELNRQDLDHEQVVRLQRWADLSAAGWQAADAHLHYDRHSRRTDPLWFAMMQGDGLASAHFMYLIGGMVPGEWAVQYGYGPKGEVRKDGRLITAGLEYRDTMQGHVNLLGMSEIIQPVMAGRAGLPNYPTLDSVLRRTRDREGLPVVAHGGSLGAAATVLLDGVLGAPDAIEIANSHLYSLDHWYALMNAGFFYPAVAGTDLPNYPSRDWWQPFLGGMRMYAGVKSGSDFSDWKRAVLAGRTFVSSGLLPGFTVNGKGAGDEIALTAPGTVEVDAELASPMGVEELQVIQDGDVVPIKGVRKRVENGITRMSWRGRIKIAQSGWLALRGRGIPVHSLKRAPLPPTPWHCSDVVAHTGVVRVRVAGSDYGSPAAKEKIAIQLERQAREYATKGRYESEAQKKEMQGLFEEALRRLRQP